MDGDAYNQPSHSYPKTSFRFLGERRMTVDVQYCCREIKPRKTKECSSKIWPFNVTELSNSDTANCCPSLNSSVLHRSQKSSWSSTSIFYILYDDEQVPLENFWSKGEIFPYQLHSMSLHHGREKYHDRLDRLCSAQNLTTYSNFYDLKLGKFTITDR